MFNKFVRKLVRERNFTPDVWAIFVNPIFFLRKELYINITQESKYINGKVLDVGCGSKPYKHLFKYKEYIGIDIANSAHSHDEEDIDVIYDGKVLPFEESSFDSAVSFQVLEHVKEVDYFLREINRVVKSGGYILITAPLIFGEHEQPYDFYRYTSFGLKYLIRKHNFKIIKENKMLGDIRIFFLLLNIYLYEVIFFKTKKKRKINLILALLSCSLSNIVGIILSKILPRNDDIYFGNILVLRNNKEK